MAALTVTKLRVIATRGENRRPSFGDVIFSDGKEYSWGRDPDGEISFSGHKTYLADTTERHSVHFGFKSKKRAAILEEFLNTK